MAASILVHVTHIEDTVHGNQGPWIYFWGMKHDQSLHSHMKSYIATIKQKLEARPPPMCVEELDKMQIYCVLIGQQWHRAKIRELKLSHSKTLEVFCIDSGNTYSIPLVSVRRVNIPGSEAEYIQNWPPLASKFILADVLVPFGTGSQLSVPAIVFLKSIVENRVWKAVPVGIHDGNQCLRLFDANNQLFATTMIQRGLGIAAKTYQEALMMCKILKEHPANIEPVVDSFTVSCDLSNPTDRLSPPSIMKPSHFPIQETSPPAVVPLEKELIETANSSQLEPKLLLTYPPQGKNFTTNQIISTVAVAPFLNSLTEFWIQLEPELLTNIADRINKLMSDPDFRNEKNFVATIGKPCLALFAADGCWYRGIIEDASHNSTTVHYVDYGNTCPVKSSSLRELPLDLAKLPPLAFKCSLDGAEFFHEDFADAFCIGLTQLSAFSIKYLNTVNDALHVRLYASDGVELVQRQLLKFPLRHARQNLNFSTEQMVSPRAVASYIKSLSEFWVQLEPKTVTTLMERLDILAEHRNFIDQKTFVPSIGKPCLVFYQDADTYFPDDGRWYRGVVEEVDGETARVYHFDYGYSCIVTMHRLRNLPSEYAKLPPLAFKCCLVGADILSKEDADDFISRFMKRYIFAVKFLNHVDGILYIRLFTLGGVDLLERHCGAPEPPQPDLPLKEAEDDVPTGPFAFMVTPPSEYSKTRSRPKRR